VEPSPDARGEYVQAAAMFAAVLGTCGMKEASRRFAERARQGGAAAGRDDLLTWGYLHCAEATTCALLEEAPWSSMTRYTEGGDALQAVGEQRLQLIVRAFRGKKLHDLGDLTGAEAVLRASLAQAERLGEATPLTYARAYLARLLVQVVPPDR